MMRRKSTNGFSLIEIIVTVAIFGMLGLVVVSAFVYGRQSTVQGGNRARAGELANEGIEAVRNIAATSYSNLSGYVNGTTYYLTTVSNRWSIVTTPQVVDGLFTRQIVFSDGPSGSRQITVTVVWQQTSQQQSSISATTYLANWQAATALPDKTGIFVYANGGTSVDTMSYRLLQTTGLWTAPLAFPDVDTTSTNHVARSVKLYSAQTGSAKMVLSKHYDGTKQYMYGTYWNGTNFITPQLLTSWNDASQTWVNAGNYGGGFLANGTFVAVYQDTTNIPKYRTFNGSTWSAQGSLPALGASTNFPAGIVLRARPGANEAMVVILGNDGATNTSYFANSAWSSYTTHASASTNLSKVIDIDWSLVDKTKAAIVFTSGSGDRTLDSRIFTANGSGGGSWSSIISSATQPTNSSIGSVGIFGRPNTQAQFIACDKDQQSIPSIYCYLVAASPPGMSTPFNNLITTATDPGGQRSFDLAYELLSGSSGLNAYSDNTASAKLKLYDSTTNTWSASAIAMPSAGGVVQKTRVVSKPNSSDAMIIVADGNKNLSSVMYNGTTNSLYVSPAGKAWTSHSTNGPSNSAVWFDFAWDS